MKLLFVNYPPHHLCKGDVVYDKNQHLLLRFDFFTRSGLPKFVVIGNERGYTVDYAPSRIMPDIYSEYTKYFQYVCKISSFTRILNRYKVYHRFPATRLGDFLRNFSLIGASEK